MKPLLAVTAILEGATGLALLAFPSHVASLLLGHSLGTPTGLTVGRVAGVALLALAIACGLTSRNEKTRAAIGLVSALLVYNVLTAALLAHARIGVGLSGDLLWPAVAGHCAMAGWCIVVLRLI